MLKKILKIGSQFSLDNYNFQCSEPETLNVLMISGQILMASEY